MIGVGVRFRFAKIVRMDMYESMVKENFLSCVISCVRFSNGWLISNVLSLSWLWLVEFWEGFYLMFS